MILGLDYMMRAGPVKMAGPCNDVMLLCYPTAARYHGATKLKKDVSLTSVCRL